METIVTAGGLFLEGLLSFFSPCVLPLIPIYIGYLTKDAKEEHSDGSVTYSRMKTLWFTIAFILGISTVFVIAGFSSQALRQFFTNHTMEFQFLGGILLILFGLAHLGIIRIPLMDRIYQKQIQHEGKMNFLTAWLMGFFFSFAWSPCIGPMLANAILMAANADLLTGWFYIASYALGFLVIFLLIGFFTEEVLNLIQKHKDIVRNTEKIAGLVIICMGGYMFYQGYGQFMALRQQPQAIETNTSESNIDIEKYNFSLESSTGETISLSSHLGKRVIVTFFGTWCHYCNEQLPYLQTIYENHEDITVLLVATPNVGSEGDKAYIEKYMNDRGYTMPILYDTDLSVTNKYGVSGYPTTYIYKNDGSLLGYVPGYVPEENMMEALEQAKV